jgi:hypothetical protein
LIFDRGRWFGPIGSGSPEYKTFDNYTDFLLVLEALLPDVGIDLILASTLMPGRPGVAMVVAKAHKRYHRGEREPGRLYADDQPLLRNFDSDVLRRP